jgi:hypothetical protein
MLPQRDPFALEDGSFCRMYPQQQRAADLWAEEGLKNLKAMMAIHEAARTGRTIALG